MPTVTMVELEALARVTNTNIPAEYKAGVLAQFQRIEALAAIVNSFPLPPEIEPATVFSNERP